jgi:hypothetical protein
MASNKQWHDDRKQNANIETSKNEKQQDDNISNTLNNQAINNISHDEQVCI